MLLAQQQQRLLSAARCIAPSSRHSGSTRVAAQTPNSLFSSLDDLDTAVPDESMASTRWAEHKSSAVRPKVATNSKGLYINSNFDSGNIDVVDINDNSKIQLSIHEDPYCEVDGRAHFQWFYFRVTGAKDEDLVINLVNAGQASYPDGWMGYQACCSYDRVIWFRVPSSYDEGNGWFTIHHTPKYSSAFYAYFAPYTYDAHMDLVSAAQQSERVKLEMLGETHDGHDIDCLVFGKEAPDKKKVWVIARQHPGESMAEWFAHGMINRLTNRHDSVSRSLLEQATLYVVPNMNPDGAWRGHLRTNACGINLNRAWQDPDIAEAPEVYHVLQKMRATGVDMLVDVHGDECIPHNFIMYPQGIPNYTDKMARCAEKFSKFLKVANPDFQTEEGYEKDEPGQANLSIAESAIAQEFDCFAMTLEQPYKDCANFPDPEFGWNPDRAKTFGASFVTAIRQIVPDL